MDKIAKQQTMIGFRDITPLILWSCLLSPLVGNKLTFDRSPLCALVAHTNSTWLYGETPVTGLTNQIASVYSYIALAKLLDANLILGEMFSRKNFEISMREFFDGKESKKILSFSDFFDYEFFKSSWSKDFEGDIVEYGEISTCFAEVSQRVVFVQRVSWRSASDHRILNMLRNSNLTCVISEQESTNNIIDKILIPKGTIIRIKSKMKMLGFYNFRQNQQRLNLLIKIHQSIRPSHHIQTAVQQILNIMPSKFAVIHMRIEGDVVFYRPKKFSTEKAILSLNSLISWSTRASNEYQIDMHEIVRYANTTFRVADPLFFESIPQIADWLTSQVYRHKLPEVSTQLQKEQFAVYVASGMFRASEGSFLWYRNKFALMLLRALFPSPSLRITTRYSLLEEHHQNNILETELAAYIDLEVARRADYFVPAHCPSSFSYTVQRLKELDRGISQSQIGHPNLSYREFFF